MHKKWGDGRSEIVHGRYFLSNYAIGLLLVLTCVTIGGCLSVQSKAGLPADWKAAMQPNGTADISGEYQFRGEGDLIPDNRISAFLPVRRELLSKTFIFRQIDLNHVTIQIPGEIGEPRLLQVESNSATGEVSLPAFSEAQYTGDSGYSSVKVVFMKGRDGALYACRTNTSAGTAEMIRLPVAGVLRVWCRFLPAK